MPSRFHDHALSARLEDAEARRLVGNAEVCARRRPDGPWAILRVAGGVAAFFGRDIRSSRAVGLGMHGPVTDADVEAVEAFYRARGLPAHVVVSPHAHPSLLPILGARGFYLEMLDTMLVRDVVRGERVAIPKGVTVRVAARSEAAAWVRVSAAGFFGDALPAQDSLDFYETAFHAPSATYFVASIDGAPIGCGAVHLDESTALFFGASTVEAFRGRGAQSALLFARLAFAEAAGCDLAFVRTAPGSASQRNAERCGFSPAYSLAVMMKDVCSKT